MWRAEVAAEAERRRARDRQCDAAPAVAAPAGEQRRDLQRRRGPVRRRVDGADAPHAVGDRLGVGPVERAGRRGRAVGGEADPDEPLGRGAVVAAEDVEQERARPGADHDVGQERVQAVAEPRAGERVAHRSRPERAADPLGGGLRDRIDGADAADALGQLMESGGAVGHGRPATPWALRATRHAPTRRAARRSP
jgi:hypothetical protein